MDRVPSETDRLLYRLGLYALAAGGLVFLYRAAFPGRLELFLQCWSCPFRGITGLPCPGCGMTRALRALVQGRLLSSLCFHPLLLPALLFFFAYMLSWTLCRCSKGRVPGLHFRPGYLYAAAALTVLQWLVKILTHFE